METAQTFILRRPSASSARVIALDTLSQLIIPVILSRRAVCNTLSIEQIEGLVAGGATCGRLRRALSAAWRAGHAELVGRVSEVGLRTVNQAALVVEVSAQIAARAVDRVWTRAGLAVAVTRKTEQ